MEVSGEFRNTSNLLLNLTTDPSVVIANYLNRTVNTSSTLSTIVEPPHPHITPPPKWKGSSFPYSQYKDMMPEDQFAKLMAMHENSASNAVMYVSIVLAVYVILLSLLLCRYMRRRPTIRELPLLSPTAASTSGSHVVVQSFQERFVDWIAKPFDAIRQCTIRSGAGVASISSGDDENDEDSHRRSSACSRDRRLSSSTAIKMAEFNSNLNDLEGRGSKGTIFEEDTSEVQKLPVREKKQSTVYFKPQSNGQSDNGDEL